MTKVIICHHKTATLIAQCFLFTICSSLVRPHSNIQPLFSYTPPTSRRRSTTTSLQSGNINANILYRGNDDSSNDDDTNNSIPLILSIENLLTASQLHDIRKKLGLHPSSSPPSSSPIDDNHPIHTLLTPTTDYQEDIHSLTATQKEDEFFLSLISSTGLSISSIPFNVTCDPLKGFVYIATHHGDVLTDDDIVRGANIIKRRQAMERWQSESGRLLMELSADKNDDNDDDDDRPFDNAARRFQLPEDLLTMLQNDVVTLVLSNETFILSNDDDDDDNNNTAALPHGIMTWTVRDATCVMYDEGQGQVPHFDPSDATLLLYIDDGDGRLVGGDTCFPLLSDDGLCVPAVDRLSHGLVFFSSFFDRDKLLSSVERDRNMMLLHHGGRVRTGKKVIVQIMLDAEIVDVSVCQNHDDTCDERVLRDVSSWIDFVACPCQ